MQYLQTWWFSNYSIAKQQSNKSQSNHQPSKQKIYWFQCIGMFVFVFLQACTKQPTGIHLQITFILMMAIPMSAKISGGHYNPAVTVSNSLCLYNRKKYNWDLVWMYFKAQFSSATFALALGYILNENFLAGLELTSETTNLFRIFFSELLATVILVFYTQLVANSQTSFVTHDGLKYFFIIAFVFVARKSAHVSSFAINPAITMATVIMDIITCRYLYLDICWTYLAGDFIGAILGTLAYNKFYVPNLYLVRKLTKYNNTEMQMQQLISQNNILQRNDSNRPQQSSAFSKNYIQILKNQQQ